MEEAPDLAETLIWEILGVPKPKDNKEIEIEEHVAEEAFRRLIYKLREKIAIVEKDNMKKIQESDYDD